MKINIENILKSLAPDAHVAIEINGKKEQSIHSRAGVLLNVLKADFLQKIPCEWHERELFCDMETILVVKDGVSK